MLRASRERPDSESNWSGRILPLAPLATVLQVDGWETWQRQTGDGAVESQQRVTLYGPVGRIQTSWSGVPCSRLLARSGASHSGSHPAARKERHVAALMLAHLFGFGRPTIQATSTLGSLQLSDRGWLARPAAGRRDRLCADRWLAAFGRPFATTSWLLPKPRCAPGRTGLDRCALQVRFRAESTLRSEQDRRTRYRQRAGHVLL